MLVKVIKCDICCNEITGRLPNVMYRLSVKAEKHYSTNPVPTYGFDICANCAARIKETIQANIEKENGEIQIF